MKLDVFIKKYRIDPIRFALECDLRPSTMYAYIKGTRIPRQDKAEAIEKNSDGLVTVFELRGKDDRKKSDDISTNSKNVLTDAKLFISEEVDTIAEEMKIETMKLFNLIRLEIENGTYKKYSKDQLMQLLNKVHLSISSLGQNKDHLARKMNKDFTPSI